MIKSYCLGTLGPTDLILVCALPRSWRLSVGPGSRSLPFPTRSCKIGPARAYADRAAPVTCSRRPIPRLFHIVHADRVASIIDDGYLWSDAKLLMKTRPGTVIGMSAIKARRLNELQLSSHPGLFVGQCVPFYFCPRSVMLYLIYCRNHEELSYRGGQEPIIHLESEPCAAVAWATEKDRRWAFTLSNAGAYYFEDRCDLDDLDQINWRAVAANRWSGRNISSQIKRETGGIPG